MSNGRDNDSRGRDRDDDRGHQAPTTGRGDDRNDHRTDDRDRDHDRDHGRGRDDDRGGRDHGHGDGKQDHGGHHGHDDHHHGGHDHHHGGHGGGHDHHGGGHHGGGHHDGHHGGGHPGGGHHHGGGHHGGGHHGGGHHNPDPNCPAPCFVAGTLIDTAEGPRPVEDLQAGDLVHTLDNGLQPIRWAGRRTVAGQGDMAPILFEAGTIGNEVELRFSPQHRILLEGWRAELLSGEPQVLAAAKHLVNDKTIRRAACEAVTYVHIMFDAHQVVHSHGARTESFHPGEWGVAVLNEQWDEIVSIFPELAEGPVAYGPTARTCLKSWEVRALLA